jgi:hypothetical protein
MTEPDAKLTKKSYNTVRSKIKKIQRDVINTLQLATRKNLIQIDSNVITIVGNCHY